MANHKSAIKRNRQNIKLRDHNRARRSEVRTAVKKVLAAIKAGKADEAKSLARIAEGKIAAAAKRNIYHRSNARRKVSRMMKAVSKAK